MINNLVESIEYNIKSLENLYSKESSYLDVIERSQKSIDNLLRESEEVESAKLKYTIAVNSLYEESIGALQNTLNLALQTIIYDKNYTVSMHLEDKRGTKTLEIALVDNDQEFEVDLKDGVGQGVRTIISFVLKTYLLINKDSSVLLLDEKYSALSAHYIPLFFKFMEDMCLEKNMKVVLITHDERFIPYAHSAYLVNDGNISKVEDKDFSDKK